MKQSATKHKCRDCGNKQSVHWTEAKRRRGARCNRCGGILDEYQPKKRDKKSDKAKSGAKKQTAKKTKAVAKKPDPRRNAFHLRDADGLVLSEGSQGWECYEALCRLVRRYKTLVAAKQAVERLEAAHPEFVVRKASICKG